MKKIRLGQPRSEAIRLPQTTRRLFKPTKGEIILVYFTFVILSAHRSDVFVPPVCRVQIIFASATTPNKRGDDPYNGENV